MKTIVSLATPKMNCAIHIIRVSGSESFSIVQKITDKKITKNGYEIQRVNIMDVKNVIDNVLLLKFVAPNSFTGEDTIEINCHGGYFLAEKIVSLLLKNGCQQAQAGEFSKRSFLNGKMTLIEAQSMNNLINATNDKAIEIAIQTNKKALHNAFKQMRDNIFKIIGQLEVNIDYPEYDDEPQITPKKIIKLCDDLIKGLSIIIDESKLAIPYRDGINVCILGRPNVGKSSLLNAIIGEEKSIVTNVPGTTRDAVESRVIIDGITINLIDTAGIRITPNKIEKIGVERSINAINNSDLSLLVIDDSKKMTSDDVKLLNMIKDKNYLVVKNKSDLGNVNTIDGVEISAKTGKIKNLFNSISKKIQNKKTVFKDKSILQTNESIVLAERCLQTLKNVKQSIGNNQALDSQLNNLHLVIENLNSILGDTNSFDFIDEMFKNFCLGK